MLIDCSELELGRNLGKRRGRLDDNVEAYKRRLELYRELTLPMLKTLDEQNRLKIVSLVAKAAWQRSENSVFFFAMSLISTHTKKNEANLRLTYSKTVPYKHQ